MLERCGFEWDEGWEEMNETEDQDMVAYVFLECGVLMLKM